MIGELTSKFKRIKNARLYFKRKIMVYSLIYKEDMAESKYVANVNVSFEFINYDNYPKITEYKSNYENQFFKMLNDKQIGVFATMGNKVIGYAWLNRNHEQTYKKDGMFKFNNDASIIHYCSVKPEYRGQGIYPEMIKQVLIKASEERKLHKIYIYTDYDNLSSQRGLAKIGFEFYKKVDVHYFLNRAFVKNSI